MSAVVRIPAPLRVHTAGKGEVTATGATVADVIDDLESNYPGIRDKMVNDKGVRRFVNIFVGAEDIRFLDGTATAVKDGDEISIIGAIAGG